MNTGVITHLGIGRAAYDAMQIVLLNNLHIAYTYENNHKAYVYPRRSVNENWILELNQIVQQRTA